MTKLRLNAEWVAAQLDGKVMLHKLPKLSSGAFASNTDIQEADSSDCQTFPDSSSRSSSAEKMERIHDTDLSEKFFVYCTNVCKFFDLIGFFEFKLFSFKTFCKRQNFRHDMSTIIRCRTSGSLATLNTPVKFIVYLWSRREFECASSMSITMCLSIIRSTIC